MPRRAAGRLLGSGLLLVAGCSAPPADQPAATTSAAGTPLPAAAKPRTTGTAVDSLNGVPGHRFGEPLSAFPGLVKNEGGSSGVDIYRFPAGSPHQIPWFAKHAQQVPGVFYLFRDGKFVTLRTVAYSPAGQAALEQEARFLFGPGRDYGDRTEWVGDKAWAVVRNSFLNGQPIKEFNIDSRTAAADQARSEQQRLKAENAQ
ncbi:hypothetical protein A0257_22710 (plasmid) [Hymenobacter psoromatis]|nr:hypothetical protein A0257_22710 [Hymenobacter psoromatis]